MSVEAENVEHEQESEESQQDIIKWLKVIAHILGRMQGIDEAELYEDID